MSDTITAPVPAYGLAQVVPNEAVAAWGARVIVTQDGVVDFVLDRTGSDEGPHSAVLLAQLQAGLPGTELQALLRDLLREGWMQTREAEDITLYMDELVTVHANTNASAGYCYVTAWLQPYVTVSLDIENRYERGPMIRTNFTDEVLPPAPSDEEARAEWADEYIFDFTGTGRSYGDSWYDVTITASSDPTLVGAKFDFGY